VHKEHLAYNASCKLYTTGVTVPFEPSLWIGHLTINHSCEPGRLRKPANTFFPYMLFGLLEVALPSLSEAKRA
jgi:hypothetical protein